MRVCACARVRACVRDNVIVNKFAVICEDTLL